MTGAAGESPHGALKLDPTWQGPQNPAGRSGPRQELTPLAGRLMCKHLQLGPQSREPTEAMDTGGCSGPSEILRVFL